MKRINILLGTRYWYVVRYIYKDSNHNTIFDFVSYVGLTNKNFILDARRIKKIISPLHQIKFIHSSFLQNGNLFVEPICYLGWFKK